jgi:hypothetical protein
LPDLSKAADIAGPAAGIAGRESPQTFLRIRLWKIGQADETLPLKAVLNSADSNDWRVCADYPARRILLEGSSQNRRQDSE